MDRRKMNTSELSRLSGIEYSFLHRITSGKRLPAKSQTVDLLAQLLSLSTEERDDLHIQFEIARVGESVFRRRKAVQQMLHNLSCAQERVCFLPPPTEAPLPAACSGRLQVEALACQIAAREAACPNGRLRLIAQPGRKEEFPLQTLQSIVSGAPALEIDHILCFDNRSEMEAQNVALFTPLLSLLFSSVHYHPFYFYSDQDTLFGDLSLFPNLLLSSRHALLISPDYASALCFEGDTPCFQLLNNRFQHCFGNCYPLSHISREFPSLQTYLSFPTSAGEDPDLTFFLSHSFFLLPFLTEELCHSMLRPDLPDREALIRTILDYTSNCRSLRQDSTCFLAAPEGLRDFLDTGLIPELPSHLTRPLPMAQRVLLVRRFLESLSAVHNPDCGLHFYDADHLAFSPVLHCICRQNLSQAALMLSHPKSGLITATILEPMISAAVADYFHALLDSPSVYSFKESLEKSKKIISEYQ